MTEVTESDAEPSPQLNTAEVKPKPQFRKARTLQTVQAATLQAFAFEAAKALRKSLTSEDGTLTLTREDAQALAMLVKAWDTAADRLRVLKGKGLPASVRSKSGASADPPEPMNPA